jgi:CysZ protein
MNPGSSGFLDGLRHVVEGLRLLSKPGVRILVLIPLCLNVLFLLGAFLLLDSVLEVLLDRYLGGWPGFIRTIVEVLATISLLFILCFLSSLLVNVFAAPFTGALSAAGERHLRGEAVAVDEGATWGALLKEIGHGFAAEMRKLRYILLRALPLLLLSLIPGLNLAAPFLWMVFGAWMLCMEYLDTPLTNHGVVFPAVMQEMRRHRRLAFGFGAGMVILTAIPILNFVAVPVGVLGATSLYCCSLREHG